MPYILYQYIFDIYASIYITTRIIKWASIYQSIYLSIYIKSYLLLSYLYKSFYLSIYLSTYLSTYLLSYLPTYLLSYLPTYLLTYLASYLSINHSLSIIIYLSICIHAAHDYMHNKLSQQNLGVVMTTPSADASPSVSTCGRSWQLGKNLPCLGSLKCISYSVTLR